MTKKYHIIQREAFSLRRNFDSRHGEHSLKNQNLILSRREAKAASPGDIAVCGEEDPGEALEFLVTEKNTP